MKTSKLSLDKRNPMVARCYEEGPTGRKRKIAVSRATHWLCRRKPKDKVLEIACGYAVGSDPSHWSINESEVNCLECVAVILAVKR